MHPKKFALWLFMISILMIFAALTSAYIVRAGEGNWLEFDLPVAFWYNSAIILVSSFTMHWAYLSAKRDNLEAMKVALSITALLGIAFLVGQWLAWKQLVSSEVYLVGNPSGSFVYVFSGVHGLHIVSAIVFVIVVLFATFRYKIHSRSMTRIEMCATYWHFLDGIWLYLFIFLLVYK